MKIIFYIIKFKLYVSKCWEIFIQNNIFNQIDLGIIRGRGGEGEGEGEGEGDGDGERAGESKSESENFSPKHLGKQNPSTDLLMRNPVFQKTKKVLTT